uniref:Sugar fermentation stimulation protein C-terminal domain-containing protein n=1 Tax=viral metagenome TaxID=1070528 RepID=A0A6C0JKH0_9ZZZZ
MSKLLMKLHDLIEGKVVKRPSKMIKSPYVADIIPLTKQNEEILGHTASLGCCGLADVGATILMAKIQTKNKNKKPMGENDTVVEKPKCEYRVYLSCFIDKERNKETIVGIHPKLAEDLTEQALTQNYLSKLQNIKSYKRETVIYVEDKVDSRFDFSGIDKDGIPFIMEVKNVPLADYEDITAIERKKRNYSERDFGSKVAYFPDGYRKKATDTVSPRALKHIRELTLIKKESKTRCIMCYVIQRTDVNRFTISVLDPQYREAVRFAMENGVEIITMVVEWSREGEAYFVRDDLPLIY